MKNLSVVTKGLALLLLITVMSVKGLMAQGKNRYFITFYASREFPPHAFVAFGKEIADPGMSVDDGAWGMAPESTIEGGKSFVIGPVPGAFREERMTEYSRSSLSAYQVEVSAEDYSAALDVKTRWTEKDYELVKQDCVTFFIEVASKIDGLDVPDRELMNSVPILYLLDLMRVNRSK